MERNISRALWVTAAILSALWLTRVGLLVGGAEGAAPGVPDGRQAAYPASSESPALCSRLSEASGLFWAAERTFSSRMWV